MVQNFEIKYHRNLFTVGYIYATLTLMTLFYVLSLSVVYNHVISVHMILYIDCNINCHKDCKDSIVVECNKKDKRSMCMCIINKLHIM